jgi:hypothetical protein
VFEDIVPRLVKVAPTAPILVVTDPPEPLIDVARHLAGHEVIKIHWKPYNRVRVLVRYRK